MSMPAHYLAAYYEATDEQGNWKDVFRVEPPDLARALVEQRMANGNLWSSIQSCGIEVFARKILEDLGKKPELLENFAMSATVRVDRSGNRENKFPSREFLASTTDYLLDQDRFRASMKNTQNIAFRASWIKWDCAAICLVGKVLSAHVAVVTDLPVWQRLTVGAVWLGGALANVVSARNAKSRALFRLENDANPHIINQWVQAASRDDGLKVSCHQVPYVKYLGLRSVAKPPEQNERVSAEEPVRNLLSEVEGFDITIRSKNSDVAGTSLTLSVYRPFTPTIPINHDGDGIKRPARLKSSQMASAALAW